MNLDVFISKPKYILDNNNTTIQTDNNIQKFIIFTLYYTIGLYFEDIL